MEKWYERFDDEKFSAYISGGEATAVYIVRDLAKEVATKGKWIDVISMNIYDFDIIERPRFNWIIVELFPRITKPKYIGKDTAENHYMTWCAAHSDIVFHRSQNHHGEKFIVLSCLQKNGTYQVTASHKVNQKKINYILHNEAALVEQITANRRPTLEILHIGV